MAGKIIPLIGAFFLVLGSVSCATGPGNSKNSGTMAPMDEHQTQFKGMTFESANLATFLEHKKGHLLRLIEFENCQFTGTLKFSPLDNIHQTFPASVIFRNCSFEGDVQANLTQFTGQVSFGKCRFKKLANFQNAVFLGPAGFRECTFDGDAQFQNAIFMRENTWMGSHFYGIGFFQAARFMEKANFSNCVFHGYADFSICRWDEGLMMDYTRVDGNIDFTDGRNFGLMNFRASEFKRIQLNQFRSFALIRFTEATFNEGLQTDGARFFAEPLQIQKPKGAAAPKETQ